MLRLKQKVIVFLDVRMCLLMRLKFWVCEGLLCEEWRQYELTDTRQGDGVVI